MHVKLFAFEQLAACHIVIEVLVIAAELTSHFLASSPSTAQRPSTLAGHWAVSQAD
jgi:hypothetical protein